MYHNVLCCNLSYLCVPRPHQCSEYRCPPCHQDRVHTLYPEGSPYTSPLGGRGWAHRRDEAASPPSLRRETVTILALWWYETPINIYLYCSIVSHHCSCKQVPMQVLKVWDVIKSSGQQPKLQIQLKNVVKEHWILKQKVFSVQQVDSPQASHSITVFFRNTISFIWKIQLII